MPAGAGLPRKDAGGNVRKHNNKTEHTRMKVEKNKMVGVDYKLTVDG